MSVTLRQRQTTAHSLDLRGILPGTLLEQTDAEIAAHPIAIGNQQSSLGELFSISRDSADDDLLIIDPLDNRLNYVGAELASGRLQVKGDVGDYAGRAMRGGQLTIEGSAGDFAGSAMQDGTLCINGNCGDRLGAPAAGERKGQQGGLIHVGGKAGSRAGECQRRGYLIIEGDAGDLLAHRMIAGTLYLGGRAGKMAGYGMRRGTLLLRRRPEQLAETMCNNGVLNISVLPLLFKEIQRLSAGNVRAEEFGAPIERHLGDLACAGQGEVLIFDT
jgi:formylmethanofuran dehydrogenase subunit C